MVANKTEHMLQVGQPPSDFPADGIIYRYGKNSKYWAANYGQFWTFGDWSKGTSFKGATGRNFALSDFDKKALSKRQKQLNEKRLVDQGKRKSRALEVWNKSTLLSGTLGEQYLKRRGIVNARSNRLKFHAAAYHPATKQKHPAVVAAVTNIDNAIVGVHVIYLGIEGSKLVQKDASPKLSYGCVSGGAVRLSNGADELIVCEGIEDGLSLLEVKPDACIWAACGSGLRNIQIPKAFKQVTIARDADDAGKAMAKGLAERLVREGFKVAYIDPPYECKDFNEALQKEVNYAN